MRKVLLTVALLLAVSTQIRAQGNTLIETGIIAASGACTQPAFYIDVTTGRHYVCTSGTWAEANNIPLGTITLVASGTCPAGSSEVAALSGKTLIGTLAANGDVGTTGGSDTITPTVASLTAAEQTVSWPAGVPTISGTTINSFSSVINHTHTINIIDPGHTHTMPTFTTDGSGTRPDNGSSTNGTTVTVPSNTTGITATSNNPAGGVASITPTINAPGTIAWPVGVPTNGTSAVTGTLNNFDNRSAFIKVIFCGW